MSINRYITRMDYSGRPHYWVRIFDGVDSNHQGVIKVQKRFYDEDCGGKREAMQAARQYRDMLCTKYKKEYSKRTRAYPKKACSSNTGLVGISHLRETHDNKDGTTSIYYRYQVSWQSGPIENRRYNQKMFKYYPDIKGQQQQQLNRAIFFRAKMVELHYDKDDRG